MDFHQSISVQTDDFELSQEYQTLREHDQSIGAIVQFVGLMRDINEGDSVLGMTLEHYPGMTEKMLSNIIEQAKNRWPLQGVRVIHRIGPLSPNDQIVLVSVASQHRQAAFDGCQFIMDFLKTRAPFWKKELTADGHRWVDAKQSDEQRTKYWHSE